MHPESGLGLLSHIGFAVLGFVFALRGFRGSSLHWSFSTRSSGKQAVTINLGWRIVSVSLGLFLAVVSTLLALGLMK
jgi:hypothetical protein